MGIIIRKLKQFRDSYVIRQVHHIKIPSFEGKKVCRYRIKFSGRVQHVGFRLEIEQLAKRLSLTGWVKNLPNGDVDMAIQGDDCKIEFLLEFMKSLKRIQISTMDKREITWQENECQFQII